MADKIIHSTRSLCGASSLGSVTVCALAVLASAAPQKKRRQQFGERTESQSASGVNESIDRKHIPSSRWGFVFDKYPTLFRYHTGAQPNRCAIDNGACGISTMPRSTTSHPNELFRGHAVHDGTGRFCSCAPSPATARQILKMARVDVSSAAPTSENVPAARTRCTLEQRAVFRLVPNAFCSGRRIPSPGRGCPHPYTRFPSCFMFRDHDETYDGLDSCVIGADRRKADVRLRE